MTEADDKTTSPLPAPEAPPAGEPASADPPPPLENQAFVEESIVYEEPVSGEIVGEYPEGYEEGAGQEGAEEGAGLIEDQIDEAPPEPEGPSLEEFAAGRGSKEYVYRRPDAWVPPKDFKPVIFTDKTNLVVEHENKSAKLTAIMLGVAVLIFGTFLGIYIYAQTHPIPEPTVIIPPTKVYPVPLASTQPAKQPEAATTMPAASASTP